MTWNTATDRILVFELTVQGDYDANLRRVMISDHEFYIVCLLQSRSLTGELEVLHAGYASTDPPGSAPHTLVMIRPDGVEERKTMEERTNGSDGYVQYQVTSTDLQDMTGRWRVRVETTWGSAITSTNHGTLDVLGHGRGSTSSIPMTTHPGSLTSSNRAQAQAVSAGGGLAGKVTLVDGITAPTAVAGEGQIYIDSADGNLKVRFGDGTISTIATD